VVDCRHGVVANLIATVFKAHRAARSRSIEARSDICDRGGHAFANATWQFAGERPTEEGRRKNGEKEELLAMRHGMLLVCMDSIPLQMDGMAAFVRPFIYFNGRRVRRTKTHSSHGGKKRIHSFSQSGALSPRSRLGSVAETGGKQGS
jgi:hypothetical protein